MGSSSEKIVRVGVGALIVRDGKILLGQRLSKNGVGSWQIPGGHLEFGEDFVDCAKREAEEECGLKDFVSQGVISVSNDIVYDVHFVTIGILLESKEGEPYAAEPEKSANWQWFEPTSLPQTLFEPSKRVILHWLQNKIV